MERWCLSRSASSSPTRIVILNPSCVFGPGGSTYSEMPHRMAKSGSFCWIEQGRGIANFCFVDNLVDAVLLAASLKVPSGLAAARDILGSDKAAPEHRLAALNALIAALAKHLTPSLIAREIDATYLIQGSVRRAGTKVRVTYVDSLPRTKSGKLRMVVSHLENSQTLAGAETQRSAAAEQ